MGFNRPYDKVNPSKERCRKAKEILMYGILIGCENYEYCTDAFRLNTYKCVFTCRGCKVFQQFCEELKNLEGEE